MIRILFLITDFDGGGAEKALYEMVRRLSRDLFAPQVACLGGPGYYTEKYRALDIPVHHFGLTPSCGLAAAGFPVTLMRTAFRLARLLRREHIQVLQTFLFHANILGRFAGSLARTPVVLGAVRTAEPRHMHTLIDGLTFCLTDGEVCVSEEVRRFQARRAGLPLDRLFVVPQGVDAEQYPVPAAPFGMGTQKATARRLRAREAFGLPADRPVFMFLGRLCAAKALPDLLAAFSKLVPGREGPALLAIGGDGPQAGMLRADVCRMGLSERVRLLGWLDDPRSLYAAADCLVLSSTVEGMPRVVLEAMAAGLPVVTTDAPGCDELVLDGETGFVVRRGHTEELASRMTTLLEDPHRAARMGLAGRRRAFASFSLRGTVELYEAIYERLLGGASKPNSRTASPYSSSTSSSEMNGL